MDKGVLISYDHEYYEPAAIVSNAKVTPSPMSEPALDPGAINGKYEFPNGGKYSGGLVHGKPHGFGVCRYGMKKLLSSIRYLVSYHSVNFCVHLKRTVLRTLVYLKKLFVKAKANCITRMDAFSTKAVS